MNLRSSPVLRDGMSLSQRTLFSRKVISPFQGSRRAAAGMVEGA